MKQMPSKDVAEKIIEALPVIVRSAAAAAILRFLGKPVGT